MSDETMTLDREPETTIEEELTTQEQETEVEDATETEMAEAEADSEDADGEDETGQSDDETPEDGWADVEVDGQTYQVPEAIKDGYMRQADYTRKTQELGERNRQLDADREAVQQIAQVSQQELGLIAELQGMDRSLEQYSKVDWNQLDAEDPLNAQQHWRNYQLLKDQRDGKAREYQQAYQQRTEVVQQETVKRLQRTEEFAKRNITGWTPELNDKLFDFAEQSGFARETLTNALTPEIYAMLHKAWIGDQVMKKQAAGPKKPPTAKKPLTKVKSKGSAAGQKPLAEMSMDEYAATRRKQMGMT